MVTANQIINADNVETLRGFPDDCIDSIVTDPPYGLAFMGKKWDYDVPSVELWQECLRVLKPGGHLLAFAGTRTQHRMAVRIEDAGFEIRDMIAWVYGSGFPKSLDVSKAIDKRGGSVAEFEQFRDAVRDAMKRNGVSRSQLQAALKNHMLSHYLTAGSQPAVPNLRDYRIIRDVVQLDSKFDALFADEAEREVVGQHRSTSPGCNMRTGIMETEKDDIGNITAPATEAAKQWQGWGTALKPALEPVTVARKPLAGTVADNVLQWGTGAMNVDGCRVGTSKNIPASISQHKIANVYHGGYRGGEVPGVGGHDPNLGRWPANLIHDGSDEVTELFPETESGSGVKGKRTRVSCYGTPNQDLETEWNGDSGSASRFFYCAKADASERRNSKHPTVKPLALMRYLVRLVTPVGGIVLDPFGGSGSTAEAARLESCRYILIEREAEYCRDAAERLRQGVLF